MAEDAPSPPKTPLELPMGMWVRGGTTSSKHDAEVAAGRADAERRRQIEDNRQRLVMQNPNEARLRSIELTDHNRDPAIVLLLEKPEDLASEQTCELTHNPLAVPLRGEPFELVLQVVCPACVYRHKRLMAEAQLQIRQSNRYFELDKAKMGEVQITRTGVPIILAGTITTHERITCSYLGCRFQFMIDKSIIRPV
jgi:hypothetical protein